MTADDEHDDEQTATTEGAAAAGAEAAAKGPAWLDLSDEQRQAAGYTHTCSFIVALSLKVYL